MRKLKIIRARDTRVRPGQEAWQVKSVEGEAHVPSLPSQRLLVSGGRKVYSLGEGRGGEGRSEGGSLRECRWSGIRITCGCELIPTWNFLNNPRKSHAETWQEFNLMANVASVVAWEQHWFVSITLNKLNKNPTRSTTLFETSYFTFHSLSVVGKWDGLTKTWHTSGEVIYFPSMEMNGDSQAVSWLLSVESLCKIFW